MTYDLAVWRHTGAMSDSEAQAEFQRRYAAAEEKDHAELDPTSPEILALFAALRARFPDEPWEDDEEDADGDFLIFSMSYGDGAWVEAAIVELAPQLGLVVFNPMFDSVVKVGDTFGPSGPPPGGRPRAGR